MTTRLMRLALWGCGCVLVPCGTSALAWADTGGAAQAPPTAVAEEMATVTVTVDDVDKRNRTMTVSTPDGDRVVRRAEWEAVRSADRRRSFR